MLRLIYVPEYLRCLLFVYLRLSANKIIQKVVSRFWIKFCDSVGYGPRML